MNLKRLAGLAAGAILVTGLFTSAAAPSAGVDESPSARAVMLDTGWGP